MVLSSTIHFLEVLSDCLVHMVAFGYKLLLFDHGPHDWVPTLDLQDLLGGGVEGFHVSCLEVPLECVQNLVIVEFPRELEKFRCLVGFLGRRVPDCLMTLSHLRLVAFRDFPRHVVN